MPFLHHRQVVLIYDHVFLAFLLLARSKEQFLEFYYQGTESVLHIFALPNSRIEQGWMDGAKGILQHGNSHTDRLSYSVIVNTCSQQV